MKRPAEGGGGGQFVSIDIPQMQALVRGLEAAEASIPGRKRSADDLLRRCEMDTTATSPMTKVHRWVADQLPPTRRRLAMAQDLARSSPGIKNVTFDESLITTISPMQARKNGREAARLLKSGGREDLGKLAVLMDMGKDDPYFAAAFARHTGPRDYEQYIASISSGSERLPYGIDKTSYGMFVDGLGQTLGLATRGRGDLALPASWTTNYVQAMTMPKFDPDAKDPYQQSKDDRLYRPALWLLMSRGRFSTQFLKTATQRVYDFDLEHLLDHMPGDSWAAATPEGKQLQDPVVALMGALAQNPEAAHWAFTSQGTSDMDFPEDGERAKGPVDKLLQQFLLEHHFPPGGGATTVLAALRAGVAFDPKDDRISTYATNLQKSLKQQKEVWDKKPFYAKWGHTILDLIGMIPLFGDPANLVNAAWYGAEKDWVNSGLSSAALVPFAGDVVLGGKLIKGGALLAKLDRLGNLINENENIAKVLAKGEQVAPGVYQFDDVKDLRNALRFGKTAANMEFRIGNEGLTFATNAEGRLQSVKVWVDGRWVTTGVRGKALQLAEYKPGETAWDLIGMPRGQVIEDALAHSEYKGWEHVGAKRNGFYPTIDFLKDGRAVSLKTMDPPNPSGVRKIRKNIDALSKMRGKGFDADGDVVHAATLDLRLRIGQENNSFVKQIQAYARTRKPPVECVLSFT